MRRHGARVALWNGSGINNIGDEAIDLVTRRELARRLPGATFETFTPWPGPYCRNELRIDRTGAWSGMGKFDAIVVGGGALLMGPPFRDPSAQFFLLGPDPSKFQDVCPVLWNGVCSDSQHRTPDAPRWREFMASSCARVSYRAVRNERTRRYLEQCGVSGPIDVIPDVCVAAGEGRGELPRRARASIAIAAGRPVFPLRFVSRLGERAVANMGVCDPDMLDLRRYDDELGYSDQRYVATLERGLSGLSAEGDITVSAFGEMYGDDLVCEPLARRLGARYRRLWDGGLEDTLRFFAGVDAVVGFRLHSCVLALAAGTPFILIDLYQNGHTGTSKMKEFALQCGMERFYFTYQDVAERNVDLRAAVRDAKGLGPQFMAEARAALRARVDAHFDRLAEMVAA